MKNLQEILEGSLLADIEDTIETGNKYENVNLTSLFNSKSKEEFETKFNIFRSMVGEKNIEVNEIKPRKCYIVFVKNISTNCTNAAITRINTIVCKYSKCVGTSIN